MKRKFKETSLYLNKNTYSKLLHCVVIILERSLLRKFWEIVRDAFNFIVTRIQQSSGIPPQLGVPKRWRNTMQALWKGACAVWRCKDCSLGTPMCRACMWTSHWHNPFHQIERWTRKFYQPAKLWEVGTYLLVQHHVGTQLCRNLNRQFDFLKK